MPEHFIMPECLAGVVGGTLFYPCAMDDIAEPLTIFGGVMAEMWFADTDYPAGLDMPQAIQSSGVHGKRLQDSEVVGPAYARVEGYGDRRHVLPSRRVERYRSGNGQMLKVIRLRGVAEIALETEFSNESISVFWHRGDSMGEGGSNLGFFGRWDGRWRQDHVPEESLFALLCRKLTNPALIVSDGSNMDKRHPIAQFNHSDIAGRIAFDRCRHREHVHEGLRWNCVGFTGPRYGPTLIWRVERDWRTPRLEDDELDVRQQRLLRREEDMQRQRRLRQNED
jgi:hypothetical protein